MQGTIVMLMALSGLGCHNKSCYVAYAPPTYGCFGGGCYANVYPADYVAPVYSGCYTSCYSGCYGGCYGGWYGGCYGGGHHGCGLLSWLFSCCGGGGCGGYGDYWGVGYDMGYSPPVFGYALQYPYGSIDQAPVSGMGATPSEAAPPVPPNPAPSTPTPTAPVPGTVSPPAAPPATPTPVEIPTPKPKI
jgi:hypothetical protein